jgi:hypothetical protein
VPPQIQSKLVLGFMVDFPYVVGLAICFAPLNKLNVDDPGLFRVCVHRLEFLHMSSYLVRRGCVGVIGEDQVNMLTRQGSGASKWPKPYIWG